MSVIFFETSVYTFKQLKSHYMERTHLSLYAVVINNKKMCDAVQMWNMQNSSILHKCLILYVNLNAYELMLQLLAYSYEYDPKAMDSEEKNSEQFSKFADESGIPNVSGSKFSVLIPVGADLQ